MIGFIYIFTLFYWGIFFDDLKLTETCGSLGQCLFIFIDSTWKEHPLWDANLAEWYEDVPFNWG